MQFNRTLFWGLNLAGCVQPESVKKAVHLLRQVLPWALGLRRFHFIVTTTLVRKLLVTFPIFADDPPDLPWHIPGPMQLRLRMKSSHLS